MIREYGVHACCFCVTVFVYVPSTEVDLERELDSELAIERLSFLSSTCSSPPPPHFCRVGAPAAHHPWRKCSFSRSVLFESGLVVSSSQLKRTH